MATRDHRSKDDEEVQAEPAVAPVVPAGEDAPPDLAPTLEDAFYTLCAAMSAALADENLVAWGHCQEIQAWMVNAGTDATGLAQQHLAWAHAVQLLEQVLGVTLTQR